MMSGAGRTVRLGLAMLVLAAFAVGQAPLAAADGTGSRTYLGPAYSADLGSPATRAANQSKIWFAADAWWALLLEPTGRTVRVFQLMPDHTWRPTSAVVNADAGSVGDVLHDGDTVHVVTRHLDGSLFYVRLSFDPAAGEYRADPEIRITFRGSQTAAAIAKDTAGKLWVVFSTTTDVVITHSNDAGRTWVKPDVLAPAGNGQNAEISAVVAYDNRIGVLWSDHQAGAYGFASHVDGDFPTLWAHEQALARPGQIDDHLNLVRVPGDPPNTLLAALATPSVPNDPASAPAIDLLVRAPDGRWSTVPVSSAADGLADPVLQVDAVTRTVHVFATANGSIVEKHASLDDLRFDPGAGTPFMLDSGGLLTAPTVSRDPADARSGLVVLASDPRTSTYRHAEAPITPPTPAADPNDHTPPGPPGQLVGRTLSPESLVLSWSPATDGDRWMPARAGVPVSRYVVLRGGEEIATVTSTSFRDDVPGRADQDKPMTVDYQVVAVDEAGNRSPPALVSVELPGAGSRIPTYVGMGMLVLAPLAALYAFRRRKE
jgi:hypothetical protein